MSWFSETFGEAGGGLVGGLVGYGLAPFTGGASLALATGLGAAAGTKLGGGSNKQALLAGGLGALGGGYLGGAEGAVGAGTADAMLAGQTAGFTAEELAGWGGATQADLLGAQTLGFSPSELGAWGGMTTADMGSAMSPFGGVPVVDAVGIPVTAGGGTSGMSSSGDLFDYAKRKLGALNLRDYASLASIGSGLYGMGLASQMRGMAQDPNAPYRAGYAAQLSDLAANPNQVQSLPGYRAGLQAVQRAQLAQGFQGSGNMMAALAKYGGGAYADRLAQLERLSGSAAGPEPYLRGTAMANQLASQSLGSLAYGPMFSALMSRRMGG